MLRNTLSLVGVLALNVGAFVSVAVAVAGLALLLPLAVEVLHELVNGGDPHVR